MGRSAISRSVRGAGALIAAVAGLIPASPAAGAGPAERLLPDFDGRPAVAYAAVGRPDGGLVAVGSATEAGSATGADLAVAAVRADGSPDPTFGGDGTVVTHVGERGEDVGQAVRVLDDGRVLVAGYTDGGHSVFLVRYRPDGSLDPAFGQAGIRVTRAPLPVQQFPEAHSVSFQLDGKVLAAGNECDSDHCTYEIMRFTSDLRPDPSFSDDGLFVGPATSLDRQAYGVVQQRDGRLVGYGYATRSTGPSYGAGLVRLNSDGSLDRTFGRGGVVTAALGAGVSDAFGVAEGPDGALTAIVYVQGTDDGTDGDAWGLLRVTADGEPDASFGESGQLTVSLGSGGTGYPYAVDVADDGSALIAGHAAVGGRASAFATLRVSEQGTARGLPEPLAFGGPARAHAVVDAGNGVLWLAGTAATAGSPIERMALTRIAPVVPDGEQPATPAPLDPEPAPAPAPQSGATVAPTSTSPEPQSGHRPAPRRLRAVSGQALARFRIAVQSARSGGLAVRAAGLRGVRCPCRVTAQAFGERGTAKRRRHAGTSVIGRRRARLAVLADGLRLVVRLPDPAGHHLTVRLVVEDRYGQRGTRRRLVRASA